MTCVLTVNAGSSSLKLSLWRADRQLASAKAENLGKQAVLSVDDQKLRGKAGDHAEALHALLEPLRYRPSSENVVFRSICGRVWSRK